MLFRSKLLCDTLNKYKEILIYGTGNYANEIYPQLIEYGLKEKIVCFVQTQKDGTDFINYIPVISLKETECNKTDSVFLIAVSELYVEEIKWILLEQEYLNIVSLVDYRIDYKQTEDDFYYLTEFEEYCEAIADWYVKTHMGSPDKSMILQQLLDRGFGVDRSVDSNLIVVICGHLSPRIVKIIRALKKKSYNIIILDYMDGDNPWCRGELKKIDVQGYRCHCVEEMLYYALQYNPLVYFFEPLWADCLWADIMLKNKKYFGNVVLSLYDVINDGYAGHTDRAYATEKYALENADGIIWRWFSKEYLEKKGFRYQGKSLQFLDCCSCESSKDIIDDVNPSVLKLCVLTSCADSYVTRNYSSEYIDWARIGDILQKIGNRKDCILHFYAGIFENKENLGICKQYEKQYDNFKIFVATEHNELVRRLRNYDYGCDVYVKGKELSDDVLIGNWWYGSDYTNSVRNAYFDFISAGLPVITTQGKRLWDYLSTYDITVKMFLEDLDIDYLKQHKAYYKENVKEARKDLDIDKQISGLIQFIKEV